MKILIVHNHYRFRGGEDLCFEADTRMLRERGHDVVHYTRSNDECGSQGKFAEARQTLWNRRTYDEVTELIDRERPDVMHVHNTFPLISPSVYDAACDRGVGVVQSLHNYRPICIAATLQRAGHICESCLSSKSGLPGVRHRCYRDSLVASAASALLNVRNRRRGVWTRKVDRFIAFCSASRDLFVRGGFPADRIELNPHFVSIDRQPLPERADAFILVARLSPEKGVRQLLEAWRHFRGDWELRIVGTGPLEDEVRAAAAKDPRIRFDGEISREQMLDRMAQSACLIFPSPWHETFGRVLIEAFALGLPVLASRLGGPLDIVDEGVNGALFDPEKIDRITAALTEFAAHRERHDSMRQAARATYLERYTEDRNYTRLMEIYRKAIDDRAAATAAEPVATVSAGGVS